ncbi:hypothetical protein LINGRAHAP2_LOCUS2255, partial [Linum grandiflorum]
FLSLFEFKVYQFTNHFHFSLYFPPFFLSIIFEWMIDFGFVSTQIGTTNLDLHTKGLESARNPPKRLEILI